MRSKPELWCSTYEENWGSRFERKYHRVYFDHKPTKEECVVALRRKYGIVGSVDWFDYGPFSRHPLELN